MFLLLSHPLPPPSRHLPRTSVATFEAPPCIPDTDSLIQGNISVWRRVLVTANSVRSSCMCTQRPLAIALHFTSVKAFTSSRYSLNLVIIVQGRLYISLLGKLRCHSASLGVRVGYSSLFPIYVICEICMDWTQSSADSNSPTTSEFPGSWVHPSPFSQDLGGRESACPPEVGHGRGDALVAQPSFLSEHILLECSAARHQSSSSSRFLSATASNGSWIRQALRRLGSCRQHFLQVRNKRKPNSESPRTSSTPRVFFASSCCCDCLEWIFG